MNRLKLLYAEDQSEIRQNHIKYLDNHYDFDIYEADDGLEAWKLYIKYKPDILLSDITMPNMDGLELIEKIREVDKDIIVIILSAHNEEDKLLKAMELNLSSYQIKPINRKKLNDSISKAINSLEKKDKEMLCYFNAYSWYDIFHKKLIVENQEIKLTKYETLLLEFFIENKNIQLNIEDIYNGVWDNLDIEYNPANVRTLVKKLRKKLPEDTIETFYGGGYKLVLK